MVGLPKKEVKSKRTTAEVWKKAMAKPQIKQEHHKNFGFWIRFLRKDGGHRSGWKWWEDIKMGKQYKIRKRLK